MGTQENTPQVERKQKFTGTVSKVSLAGALVDIGLEKPGVLHISRIQEEPVKNIEDVLKVGQEVTVWVRRLDKKTGLVELTMVEPLAMEWQEIKKGMTVKGTVTKLEKFAAFIEIGAERPAFVHVSEITHDFLREPGNVMKVGDEVEGMVLEVNRRRKQIKVSMKALIEEPKLEVDFDDDDEDDEPIMSPMEYALKKAMGEIEDDAPAKQAHKKSAKSSKDMDEIVSRTLARPRN